MNASYSWLRDFVDIDLTPQKVAALLTAQCATVDEVTSLRQDLSDIVVGRVVEAARHPDSDHLWVTKVDAGRGSLLEVVCGAPNVRAGASYPFAPVGTSLGGLKIEKRKIRGVLSNGMLCSARELGLGSDHEGILELPADAPAPGTPLLRAIPIGDTRIVIDVFPNRPDLLSHRGLAREIAAGTKRPLRDWRPVDESGSAVSSFARHHVSAPAGPVSITIEDADGCPRYIGVVIRGVSVGPSPNWLQERLAAVGARTINNIVDVTNMMLHGYGQPMHAFDLARLSGPAIRIRSASHGETIRTLDGVDRTLDDRTLVIADAERAQAIAGIIGGQGSEVTDKTTDILLEVASFDPRRIRMSRRRLGISTDASYRYERGVPTAELEALARIAAITIVALASGRVEGAADVEARTTPESVIALRPSRVNKLLGDAVPPGEVQELLSSVGFTILAGVEDRMDVRVPSWRRDVTIEADLIEEVARLRGYDSFSTDLRPFRVGNGQDAPSERATQTVREKLVGAGLLETRAMPFVSTNDAQAVRVRNPVAENEAFLRTSVLDTLARRAEHNLAHMQRSVRLFEIGAVFRSRDSADAGDDMLEPYWPTDQAALPPDTARVQEKRLPVERLHVAALLMGPAYPPHFTQPDPRVVDEWDVKHLAEVIVGTFIDARSAAFEEGTTAGDLWRIEYGGRQLGVVRRVSLDAPVWASPAFGVEVDLGLLLHASSDRRSIRYRPLPVTPAVELDLALLVPEGRTATEVEAAMRGAVGELLEKVELFDEFRSDTLPPGTRSVAWRLTFRHPERTLRDKEVEARKEKLLRTLDQELGVRQRTS
jgi:phenylalanyl-tRNA synthetase beta chain